MGNHVSELEIKPRRSARWFRFLREQSGVTAPEYATMLGLILLAIFAAIGTLGETFGDQWQANADHIIDHVNEAANN